MTGSSTWLPEFGVPQPAAGALLAPESLGRVFGEQTSFIHALQEDFSFEIILQEYYDDCNYALSQAQRQQHAQGASVWSCSVTRRQVAGKQHMLHMQGPEGIKVHCAT